MPFKFDGHLSWIAEFFIDDKPLCAYFKDTRHLGNCQTDFIQGNQAIFQEITKNFVAQLTGKIPPNPLEDKVVLYRCHCGCVECGVVSCKLVMGNDTVKWQDCTNDNDENEPPLCFDFVFNKTAYLKEIERFFKECQNHSSSK